MDVERGDYDTTITVHPDPIALIDTLGSSLDCDGLQLQGLIAANTTTSIANTYLSMECILADSDWKYFII